MVNLSRAKDAAISPACADLNEWRHDIGGVGPVYIRPTAGLFCSVIAPRPNVNPGASYESVAASQKWTGLKKKGTGHPTGPFQYLL
jgi:hypothetical protein